MGRLSDFAKDSKAKKTKGYHWKVDADTYNLFKKYCRKLNLSINEALTKLVELEIEDYKEELTRRKTTRAKPKRKAKKEVVADGDGLRVVDEEKK